MQPGMIGLGRTGSNLDFYRKQVGSQANLVLAMHPRAHAFTAERKARDLAHYEGLTVRDSPLSARAEPVFRSEVCQLEMVNDYLIESALMDMDELKHKTRAGLLIASLAGAWIALVAGSGGLRERENSVAFAPRLPDARTRFAVTITLRGRRLHVELTLDQVSYRLREGEPLQNFHARAPVTASADGQLRCPLTREPAMESPPQPTRRAPASHRARSAP